MTRIHAREYLLPVLSLMIVVAVSVRSWGVDPWCNMRKPIDEGHCGQEGPVFCDVGPGLHTGFIIPCDAAEFVYHEDWFSYDDQVGGMNDYAYEKTDAPEKRCTCKYHCHWDEESNSCALGAVVMIPSPGGTGIIPDCDTQTEWGSKNCVQPPSA